MREDFVLDNGQEGYACFADNGECTQFVLFWYDGRYGNYRFPVAYGSLEFQDTLTLERDMYLLNRLLKHVEA